MKLFSIFLLFFNLSCFGASPLFHAVIAEKWLEHLENYNDAEKKAFLTGTLFPDIRYLAKFDRKLTHESGLSIDEIRSTESPFVKGMRVHTFVDDIRVKYLKDHAILDFFGNINHEVILNLKFLEDQILFSKRNDSSYICSYLAQIEPEELNFPVSLEMVQIWHAQNIWYLTLGPEQAFNFLILADKDFGGMKKIQLENCYSFIQNYRDTDFIKNYVNDIIIEFENLFKEYK